MITLGELCDYALFRPKRGWCDGKKAHDTLEEATAHFREQCWKQDTARSHTLRVYRCRTCRKWHIGHTYHGDVWQQHERRELETTPDR